MMFRKLLGDLTPIVMISDNNELLILIKDHKYLMINLNDSNLQYDYLDISDIIDDVDENTKWKVLDIKSGESTEFIGRIPEDYITVNELVVRLK